MKLGIFGDSFGTLPPYVKDFNEFDLGPAWFERLQDDYTVDNYCEWGSTFARSVYVFLKNYHKYDKILFTVTSPGRICSVKDNKIYNWSNLGSAKSMLDCHPLGNDVVNAAIGYFEHIDNKELSKVQHNGLISLINSTHDNVYMLPCFPDSIETKSKSLGEISLYESKTWNWLFGEPGYFDIRKGHIADENHHILYRKILTYLQTGSLTLNLKDFIVVKDKQRYLFTRTLEDTRFRPNPRQDFH